jgi:NADH-quinone oxidoreductase subunit J
MELVFFLIFAVIAIVSAVNVIIQTQPISSALSLIGVMVSLAALYLFLGADFLAMAQIIVYAGAIMVLFVFTIMLLNTGGETGASTKGAVRAAGLPALLALLVALCYTLQRFYPSSTQAVFGGFTKGDAHSIGNALFRQYLLPFEVTSILILVAILGAIVLARKEID